MTKDEKEKHGRDLLHALTYGAKLEQGYPAGGAAPRVWSPVEPAEINLEQFISCPENFRVAKPCKLYVRLAWRALPNFEGHTLELAYANSPNVLYMGLLFRGWATEEFCIEDMFNAKPSAAPVPQVNPNIKEC